MAGTMAMAWTGPRDIRSCSLSLTYVICLRLCLEAKAPVLLLSSVIEDWHFPAHDGRPSNRPVPVLRPNLTGRLPVFCCSLTIGSEFLLGGSARLGGAQPRYDVGCFPRVAQN